LSNVIAETASAREAVSLAVRDDTDVFLGQLDNARIADLVRWLLAHLSARAETSVRSRARTSHKRRDHLLPQPCTPPSGAPLGPSWARRTLPSIVLVFPSTMAMK
jgi:hypothetical protein